MNPSFVIPTAINHLLASEPWAQTKLAAHAGKVARIDAGLLDLNLKVAGDGMLEAASSGVCPNVTIHLKLSDLPLMAQNRERAFSYVQIEGDADFASTIAQVAQSLRWEAEEDLSKIIGDIAARRMVFAGKTVADAVQTTHRKMTENLAEYFLEENPMLVRPSAVAEFASDVARLRDDVERLAKRIDKLTREGK